MKAILFNIDGKRCSIIDIDRCADAAKFLRPEADEDIHLWPLLICETWYWGIYPVPCNIDSCFEDLRGNIAIVAVDYGQDSYDYRGVYPEEAEELAKYLQTYGITKENFKGGCMIGSYYCNNVATDLETFREHLQHWKDNCPM